MRDKTGISFGRRDFIKFGTLGTLLAIGGFCPFADKLMAADKGDADKDVKFDIIKGNKCKRCLNSINAILENAEMRKELSQYFPDRKKVTVAYGSRARVKKVSGSIAVGNCARKLKSPIYISGCAPKPQAILDAVKQAYDDYEKDAKGKKEYGGLFGK
ncbi:MAG: hypothetical protein JXR97_07265 [Planctomycetes bacterium]|nr:hypothetical protein [Planctomycetota bacterium]